MISDYFSCLITLLNLVEKTLPSMGVYTKSGKQPSNTISCPNNFITSAIFVVSFAYLLSNPSPLFALKRSYYHSKVSEHFLSDYNVYRRNRMVVIVTDLFSYHLIMRSRVVPDSWRRTYRIHAEPYKHNPNPVWKGIQYAGDPVLYKQGLSFTF